MKIKEKTVYVQTPQHIKSYIASDGYEFEHRNDCENHEIALGYKGIKVVETAYTDLEDFYSEDSMALYKIENEDDWNILVERVWFYRQNEKEYPGPGLYFAVKEFCGDYPSEYTIYEYDNYMDKVHRYYNHFCNDMEDAYKELNT